MNTLKREANARLIAQAPAMYEALRRLVTEYDKKSNLSEYVRIVEIATFKHILSEIEKGE